VKRFAAFDLDGTLIRWQLYHAVVDRLATQNQLNTGASDALRQARMKWKRRDHPEAFRAYEQALIKVFEAALPSLNPNTFDKTVQAVTDEYADQVYTYTRKLIKDLKAKGFFLLAISGSHQEIVERIGRHYGFDAWRGSDFQRQNGQFTGQKTIASQNKQAILEEMIGQHQLTLDGSLAVGDSASDAPMLKLVQHPIAFNPDRELFKIAQQAGWPIVIERKNMIYQLEAQDGRYILS
jgi:HAD superfamily hydrolase (TIGR01490 family)